MANRVMTASEGVYACFFLPHGQASENVNVLYVA